MATVSLERQIFYTPPMAPHPKPASRGLPTREDPSATISGAFHLPLPPPPPPPPPPPLQNARSPRYGGTGMLQDDVIEIPSDDEPDQEDLGNGRADTSFDATLGASGDVDVKEPSVTGGAGPDYDDLDDSQSDTDFPPLDELLAASCKKVGSSSAAGAGKSVSATPGASGDRDAPEPSVTSGASPDDKSVTTQ
ncbi:hypothetical protein MMYC01_209292 [Madurella mycetomatis]|uniref:Uncharacterized protein n=1 Tax=Madurella mycetomatis TaxID=100816 RepID=A0A175VZH4_9PEZI|nr:hypothetical protein MMYC01_209292 [Madurella mycetomatis]